MPKLQVAYMCEGSHNDRWLWSGTVSQVGTMLERLPQVIVTYLDNLAEARSALGSSCCADKRYPLERHPCNLKAVSNEITSRLASLADDAKPDILFTVSSPLISMLETDIPIVLYTDACFAGMLNYYDSFSNFSAAGIQVGNYQEKLALQKASHIFYASEWAAESAVNAYGIDRNKISVVRFGANMPDSYRGSDLEQAQDSEAIKLLFVGVDWVRKGGTTALEVVRNLMRIGQACELHVVGCSPEIPSDLIDNVDLHGFLDKTNDDEARILAELFMNSDIMLFPTLQEAAGIVCAEAAMFGLPVIARDTGGVSSMVIHGHSGILLPESADAEAFSNAILMLLDNQESYLAFRQSARNSYENELSWDAIGKKILPVLRELAI